MDYLFSDPNFSVIQNTLRAWHNDAAIVSSPLAALKSVDENRRAQPSIMDAVRKTLLDAINDLKPSMGEADWQSVDWQPHLIFRAQVIDRWSSTQMTDALAVSKSEYYRIRRRALTKLAAALASKEREAQQRARRNLRARVSANFSSLLPSRESDCFVGRDQVRDQIKQELLTALGNRRLVRLALYGLPGVGKSSLAAELTADLQIQDAVSGLIWLNAGNGITAERLLLAFKTAVHAETTGQTSDTVDAHIEAINEALAGQEVLLFVDDVWDISVVQPLAVVQGVSALVVTTRLPKIAYDPLFTTAIHVEELSIAACVEVVRHYAPTVVDQSRDEIEELATLCGGLPMAVMLAAKRLRRFAYGGQGRRALQVVDLLRDRSQRLLLKEEGEPTQRSLEAAIDASVSQLDERHRKALAQLAILSPSPNTFSLEAFNALTGESVAVIDDLTDLGLIEPQLNDRYRLHQCLADYFLAKRECDALSRERASNFFANLAITNRIGYSVLSQELPNILQVLRDAPQTGWSLKLIEAGCVVVEYLHSFGLLQEADEWSVRIAEASERMNDTRLVAWSRCLRGQVCLEASKVAEAERLFQDVTETVPASGATEVLPAAHEGLAKIAQMRNDVDEMRQQAALAAKIAEATGQRVYLPRLLAMTYVGDLRGNQQIKPDISAIGRLLTSPAMRGWMLGFMLYIRGHPQRAERVLRSALQQAQQSGRLAEEFTIRAFLSIVLLTLSKFDESEQVARIGLELREHFLLPRSLGFCYVAIGHARYVHGQAEIGIRDSLEWHAECLKNSRPESAALALLKAAHCALITEATLTSAIAWSQDSMGLLKLTGQTEFIPFPLAIGALAHMKLGNASEAHRLFEQSERLMTLDYAQSMPVHAALAETLVLDRQYARAEQLCRHLLRNAQKYSCAEVEADACFFLARALIAQNEQGEALLHTQKASELYASIRHFRHPRSIELLTSLQDDNDQMAMPTPQTLRSDQKPVDRNG